MGLISKRKEYDIRTKKKKIINAINRAIEALIKKGERGETYRDEDLRFLRNVFKDLKALEESIADDRKTEELPEGKLRQFVEMEWRLKDISKDREKVLELTGYYRCQECGEAHIKGRLCAYKEYEDMQKDKALDPEEEGGQMNVKEEEEDKDWEEEDEWDEDE